MGLACSPQSHSIRMEFHHLLENFMKSISQKSFCLELERQILRTSLIEHVRKISRIIPSWIAEILNIHEVHTQQSKIKRWESKYFHTVSRTIVSRVDQFCFSTSDIQIQSKHTRTLQSSSSKKRRDLGFTGRKLPIRNSGAITLRTFSVRKQFINASTRIILQSPNHNFLVRTNSDVTEAWTIRIEVK